LRVHPVTRTVLQSLSCTANLAPFYDVGSVETAVARRNFVNSVAATNTTADFLRTLGDYSGSTTQHRYGLRHVTVLEAPGAAFLTLSGNQGTAALEGAVREIQVPTLIGQGRARETKSGGGPPPAGAGSRRNGDGGPNSPLHSPRADSDRVLQKHKQGAIYAGTAQRSRHIASDFGDLPS